VADLEKARDDFESSGLGRALIGNGPIDRIGGFRKATGWSGPLYTDPDKSVYNALDFKHGMGGMMGLKSVTSLVGSLFSGHGSTAIQGDALQQGGVLVAGPGDEVHFFYRNKEAGDYPATADILAAGKKGPEAEAGP
jgi:hypothetical protein